MNVAIFCADFSLVSIFIEQYFNELAKNSIFIKIIVHDQNTSKKRNFLAHSIKIASRQAKVARCTILSAFLRRAIWRMFIDKVHHEKMESRNLFNIDLKPVSSLNTEEAIGVTKENHCDFICLMGTRVLSKRILEELGIPVINIHSSDPKVIRGGPSVFWEIYNNSQEISLTIHKVTEVLDAGTILLQQNIPIIYKSLLAETIKSTLLQSQGVIAKMFRDVLISYKSGTLREMEYAPGQLFVTPSIGQMVKAQFICMKNYRHTNSS